MVWVGDDARESRLKREDLTPYSHLHFATHGVLAGELPTLTEPALVLSEEDGEDGFLTASEVHRLKSTAELVVLSACNTGAGNTVAGEGVIAMGRSFLLAGARTVLVSLWPVDSLATEQMMTRFYRNAVRCAPIPRSCCAAFARAVGGITVVL